MKIIDKIQKKILYSKVKKEGGNAFSTSIRKYYEEKYDIKIGYGTYGGCFDINNIPAGTVFGNYCSIASGVRIFRANHPMDYFTLHPLFYNPSMNYVKEYKLDKSPLIIGHDVWIGANAIILPSVNFIGNGAVIGAGSVVTKDVLPYSIVVGNPARTIRFRFNSSIIEKIEKTEWWLLKKEELIEKKDYLEELTNG